MHAVAASFQKRGEPASGSGLAALAVVLVGAASLPASAAPIPLIQTNGPIALEQARLMRDALLLMAIVVLPVFVLTGTFVWRYRRSRQATYRPDWSFSLPLELAIWGIPTCIVVALGFLVWTRTHALDPYAQAGPGSVLEVQAIATDWKWVFLYPGLDVATVNELVVPADRPFRVALTSDTVMNAFFIPGLGGQIFAMAGMRTQINLRATSPAEMWGRNMQFSGNGFYGQEFRVHVVDAHGFDAWRQHARAAGGQLTRAAYEALAKQQATAPATTYARFDPGLFDEVIAKYHPEPHR